MTEKSKKSTTTPAITLDSELIADLEVADTDSDKLKGGPGGTRNRALHGGVNEVC